MATQRKLDALRALAERPGTEAEGRLAREILDRIEASAPQATAWELFDRYLRTRSMDDLMAACKAPSPCDCGEMVPHGRKCSGMRHARICEQKLILFPRGTRVYYNMWAYSANSPGRVTGPGNTWNWLRIKFDHLKSARNVPIYRDRWHLSIEPLDTETARRLAGVR